MQPSPTIGASGKTAAELIDALGGSTAVARILHIAPPSVHNWRNRGIPEDKLIRLAPILEAQKISTRKKLMPNDYAAIWPELAPKSRAAKEV